MHEGDTAAVKEERPHRRFAGSWARLTWTLLGIGLLLLPLAGGSHTLSVLTVAFIFAGISSGWAIAGGLSGLIPLGHAAFFGLGAYASALVFARLDLSPLLGIVVGAGAAAALAWVITVLAVRFRVRGAYFALYTLAWAEACRLIATNSGFLGKTSGVLIPYRADAGALDLQFSDTRGLYAVAAVYLFLALLVFWLVKRSSLGWRLSAIRGDEATAAASGIDVSSSLTRAMVISAVVTAVGGGLYAQYIQFIDPELAFNVAVSIDIAVRAILGGAMLVLGPVLGTGAITLVTEGTHTYLHNVPTASLLIVGIAIVALAHWFPRGLAGLGADLKRLVDKRRKTQ